MSNADQSTRHCEKCGNPLRNTHGGVWGCDSCGQVVLQRTGQEPPSAEFPQGGARFFNAHETHGRSAPWHTFRKAYRLRRPTWVPVDLSCCEQEEVLGGPYHYSVFLDVSDHSYRVRSGGLLLPDRFSLKTDAKTVAERLYQEDAEKWMLEEIQNAD